MDCCSNFQSIANNPWVGKKTSDVFFVVAINLGWVEAAESLAVILTFVQHGLPVKTRLSTFENKEFEERFVVVNRLAPFLIMVLNR